VPRNAGVVCWGGGGGLGKWSWRGSVGMKLRARRSVLRSGSRGRRKYCSEGLELIAVGGGSAVDVIVLTRS